MRRRLGPSVLDLESGDERRHYFAGDVGEAEIAALETVGKLAVIEAELVEQGGVEVMDVDGIGDGGEAEIVRCADGGAGADTAAREPDGVSIDEVVPSRRLLAAFGHRGAAELASPDDEGLVEEPAAFEVGTQGGARASQSV